MAEEGKGGSTIERARAALRDGNYALARRLARQILRDAAASTQAKTEARPIADATRVDPAAIVVGIVMIVVLAALFSYVLHHAHG